MFWKIADDKKERVRQQIRQMSLDEKIGQLVCERNTDYMEKSNRHEWLKQYPIGSMFVGAEIIQSDEQSNKKVKECIDSLKHSKVPVVFCGDFEHGIGCQISGFTKLPDLMALGATHNPKLAYEYGRIIAEEGRALDLRWAFGPVADLNTNLMNPVTNVRSMGDQPEHVAGMLKELVRGMQDHGMAACPKHFPGDGTDTRNQHIVTSLNLLSKKDWDQLHGRVFQELIDAGAASIMIGHLGFPAYEPLDEQKEKFCPATASKKIMTDLLRGELGFQGIILTDALCMNGFTSWGSYEDRLLASFNGGTDVFLWPETERFFELMKAALHDGRASMERLEESVERVMCFKAWLDLTSEKYELTDAALQANNAISEKVGEQSLTLLRNRANHLPLKPSDGAEILMLVLPGTEQAMKPLQCFKEEFEKRGFQVTLSGFPFWSDFSQLEGLKKFEWVFLICNCRPLYVQWPTYNNYGFWSFMQHKDIKNKILFSLGTPYFLYEITEADTYINSYSDSENSQKALVKALFGEIPFAGRSPVALKNCFDFGGGRNS